MKQRDPNWREIRKHHVIPDKRSKLMEEIHDSMVQDMVDRCPRCGGTGKIEVHGHYQCSSCRSVIDDCCQGETCQVK